MKIIITGASGFVGKNLSRFLKENGNEVFPISMRDSKWENRIDMQATALIHLAGKAHDTSNKSLEDEYYKINTQLTEKIYDQFLESDIRDFFYFSSVKATADSVMGILDENHESLPNSPYGISKMRAEKYLLSKKLPENKRLFIIRPCMIHGRGNKGNLNLLFNVVKSGIPWPLGAFKNKRTFLNIDNLNFLIYKMLQENIPSGIYNFADDEPISTNKLVEIIAKTCGKKPKILNINPNLILKFAKLGDKIGLPLNSQRLDKLTESYVVSNLKIKNNLGLDKLPVSTEVGLEKTIKSFLK